MKTPFGGMANRHPPLVETDALRRGKFPGVAEKPLANQPPTTGFA
jgi:hypothetical protein